MELQRYMNSTKQNKIKIIVDIERMKYPFTGLYFYCKDLALSLEKYHADQFDYHFFSYPGVLLPKHLKLIIRRLIDKSYLVKPKEYKLWHSTWQDTKLVPRNKMKFVYTIHDLNFLYTDKTKTKKKELLKAIQHKIDRADAITVISNFVKEDVKKNLNIRGKEIHVIHNGVELEEFPNFDTPSYRPATKYLFTLGTVLYKKHFHVLPRILVGNDYELIIAGIHANKNYLTQIKDEAIKYGVADRVKLIGTISSEEKYWYLNNTEAFLFPSISEGFGLPPIEAMRLGKPTFLSTHTSLPEIGGENAYYFDSFEPESMQKVFKNGLEDYHKNNKKEAIITWSKQFNWERASAAYVKVYKKALGIEDSLENNETINKKCFSLTAIIPTLNEETNIKTAINAVQFANEIIVIDSYSTDNTVAIAKEMGATVILRKFDNFSSQKNYAIAKAKHDWIYVLDADERVSNALENEIVSIVNKNPSEVAFSVKMNYFFMGKLMKHGSFKTKTVTRLFRKKFCKYDGKPVHEQLTINGELASLTNYLDHNSDKSMSDFVQTQDFYATLKAKELFTKKDNNLYLKTLVKPPFRFLKHYIIQLGFLDGFQGLVFASIQSYGVFMRYVKLWEMKNKA